MFIDLGFLVYWSNKGQNDRGFLVVGAEDAKDDREETQSMEQPKQHCQTKYLTNNGH